MREFFELECRECGERNYSYRKNKRTHSDRLELKKFCPVCRKHAAHRERK